MSDRFDLHLRYPELFEPLTEEQRRNVMQPLASSELPPVSWTTKLKSKKQEAFHVRASGNET